jgi:hypothetical protein
MSDRQKLFYALVASAFLHLAIGLVLAFWSTTRLIETTPVHPDLSQLTVTIIPHSAPTPAPVVAPTPPPARQVPPVLDSDGLTTSTKAPEHPVFQSDANMVAASRLPATGNIPLPSAAGPRRNFRDFANIPASSGKGLAPSAHAINGSQAATAAQSMPEQTPFAVTKVETTPTPAPATPTPKPVPTTAPDDLALGKPTPTPAPTPVTQLASLATPPPLRADTEMTPMTRPAPAQPASPNAPEPATQRELDKTRIDGGINTPGEPAVDAEETPFGRYHRKLSNLIGSRWQLYLQEHPKDVGDVTILVLLDTSGKVAATRVIANHSMDDLADLSTRAIMESDLPPVPDDLAPMLRNGKLEITFNFNVYDPNNEPPGR